MDAYHEKDNPHKMRIVAHERCIVASPNKSNWDWANRSGITKEEVDAVCDGIRKIAQW